MRKITFIFVAALLLLAACNATPDDTEVADEQAGINEAEQGVDAESDATDDEDETDDTNADVETDSSENTDEGDSGTKSEEASPNNDESTGGDSNDWNKPKEIENMDHLKIVHLAYDIFAAQDRKDYDFLQSVAAEGTTIDRTNNKFSFENVTYPFEMEFFTKKDLGALELRYTHEEDAIVHVGFGAINYEEESSFVVEFEFVKEGGAWKLLSMDVNA